MMVDSEEEEDEESSHMTVQSSRSSSIHVVELEGYASDNSDGEGIEVVQGMRHWAGVM